MQILNLRGNCFDQITCNIDIRTSKLNCLQNNFMKYTGHKNARIILHIFRVVQFFKI